MEDNGNVTVSVLRFTPKPSDQGRTVTCRAENVDIRGSAIEEHWKLVVHRE